MVKKEITKDYPQDGDYSVVFYTKRKSMFGATVEKDNDRWIYSEFDDRVSGFNQKTYKKKSDALKFLRKRLPKIKEEAVEEELEE